MTLEQSGPALSVFFTGGIMLDVLYKKNSSGKVLMWHISTVGNTIVTVHGQLEGKQQTDTETILKGKNIGKANETTPIVQAQSEAISRWNKKQDRKGYKLDITKLDVDERPSIDPQLAQTYATVIEGVIEYKKAASKILLPCDMQPKLDGHRIIAEVINGVCKLYSKERNPINSLPHINRAIEGLGVDNIVYDGEGYHHEYKDKFEELTGFIASKEPKEGHEVVQYHIYDTASDGSFLKRSMILNDILIPNRDKFPCLKLVRTVRADTKERVVELFREFQAQGYEGAMLRNISSLYENKRSYNLQKFKEFDDGEYKIIGIKEGRGKMKGHAVFICEIDSGTFDVKLDGDMSRLKEIYENQEEYIGKMLTVIYQGLTNGGKPRFPIGLRFRRDV